MPREVVNIHIGQAGIQMANAAWEIFCIEHDIFCNGRPKPSTNESWTENDENGRQCFFEPLQSGSYVPRAIFIDTEPTVIDEIRTGSYRYLFRPTNLISGKEDAANNYARGYYTLGRMYIDSIMSTIRKNTEACDNMQGFLITHSYGGGTGSGITSLLMEKLSDTLGKYCKVELMVYPSLSMSTAVVEPYNCVLNGHSTMENCDISLIVDNEALYDISQNKLGVKEPKYSDINRVIAQVAGSITTSIRFMSTVNADLDQLQTNLIPYPRLHFPLIRQAPLYSKDKIDHAIINTRTITHEVFHRTNQMIKLDTLRGKYMSICLCYRGNVSINDANKCVQEIKEYAADVKFVDWCQTGFKLGICSTPPTIPPVSNIAETSMSVSMLANTSAAHQAFSRLMMKYKLLHSKKAFIHHYVGEGLEEQEFDDAFKSIVSIEQDYLEAGKPSPKENKGDDKDENEKAGTRSASRTPKSIRSNEQDENEKTSQNDDPRVSQSNRPRNSEINENEQNRQSQQQRQSQRGSMNERKESQKVGFQNQQRGSVNDQQQSQRGSVNDQRQSQRGSVNDQRQSQRGSVNVQGQSNRQSVKDQRQSQRGSVNDQRQSQRGSVNDQRQSTMKQN